MKRAVFLDRDGVINASVYYEDTKTWESPRSAAQFSILPSALDALKRFQSLGYLQFLVSNQPGFAKGKTSLEAIEVIHANLKNLLEKNQDQ
jgi:D-glycero-D-manno-heptose 1,7-bisphosphate phosphatase